MALSRDSQLIEKLNQHNYSHWSFKMSMILIKEELYEIVTDTPPNPITADWSKKDKKARALINLCIDDNQIVHVREKETAKETWDTLKLIHERSNLSSKLFLLRKLYNTKLEERGNMITHITKILEIVNKLKAIDEKISDSHLSAILLCSVPQSYDTLITALEARPEAELNSEFIRRTARTQSQLPKIMHPKQSQFVNVANVNPSQCNERSLLGGASLLIKASPVPDKLKLSEMFTSSLNSNLTTYLPS
ncbi:copia protein [Parasteatoda tepidariorum]|uniref:copia protein n=1 Tax=Parasteatoda tepidariorum TaxID=114398 RepID=UPI0039BD31E6